MGLLQMCLIRMKNELILEWGEAYSFVICVPTDKKRKKERKLESGNSTTALALPPYLLWVLQTILSWPPSPSLMFCPKPQPQQVSTRAFLARAPRAPEVNPHPSYCSYDVIPSVSCPDL